MIQPKKTGRRGTAHKKSQTSPDGDKQQHSDFYKKKSGQKAFRSKEDYRVEKRKAKDEIYGNDRKHSRYQKSESGKVGIPTNRDKMWESEKVRPETRDQKPYRHRDRHETTNHKPQTTNVPGLTRLNKYIANSGICSRREADDLISAGVISVNGKIITQMGYKISSADVVKFHDKTMRNEKPVYLLLNKPKDYITTTDDPLERKTVMNLIQGACKERIYPVGRLDRSTTGLLLFTNDGELTKKLTHPSHGVKKIYHAGLDKPLTKKHLEDITNGIELEDGKATVDSINYVGDDRSEIGLELHSGKNRIVRRIFEHLDYKVKKLDRVTFAGLTKKDLPRGRWRLLSEKEVAFLKMQVGK